MADRGTVRRGSVPAFQMTDRRIPCPYCGGTGQLPCGDLEGKVEELRSACIVAGIVVSVTGTMTEADAASPPRSRTCHTCQLAICRAPNSVPQSPRSHSLCADRLGGMDARE